MNQSNIRSLWLFIILVALVSKGNCQTSIPEVLNKNTLKEQIDYIEEHSRIYENYRAIREDIFQKIKENYTDTIAEYKNDIKGLKRLNLGLRQSIDTLEMSLKTTQTNLNNMTITKNSIRLFGLEVNKITYNSILWTVIIGLLGLLAFGLLILRRTLIVTNHARKELKDLKDEFEAYRKKSREAREKMSMDHFNEVKRLKGG